MFAYACSEHYVIHRHPGGLGCSLQGMFLHRDLLCHRPASRAFGHEKPGAALCRSCACNLLLLLASVSLPGKRGIQGYLSRLLSTRREAESIMAVTPAGRRLKAIDFDASRTMAMNPTLAQHRIVHFATHGFLDSKHPELSGLVLSLVNKQGRPVDGFLNLQDIYNLSLPVDLVVLSACETALGEEINGEGIVGLTRGFMYAGATRVIASLWNVSDEATSELMTRFYRAMEVQHLTPAAALRQAQIQMWKQNRWAPAYYWAAFQIQGEWK
jgi:CHAT domain-containing protein